MLESRSEAAQSDTFLWRYMRGAHGGDDGVPQPVDVPKKRSQIATNSVARAKTLLLRNEPPRASLPAVPAKTRKPPESAKRRHMRITAYNLRRVRRDLRKLTQQELANRIGVRREQIVHWESGKDYEPGPENLEKLCHALDIDERELRTPIPEPLEPAA